MQGRPDNCFDNVLQVSSILPESARTSPIQLYSAYFTAPFKELVDLMLTRGFQYIITCEPGHKLR